KGDTFGAIAKASSMTMAELQALNPDININKLSIGQLLTVKETIPYLSVCTVDDVVYTEPIECPVKEVEDPSMYQGDSKVLEAGVPGEALVEASVTYVNGKEQERTIHCSTTLCEASTKVVAVGTKARPTWHPNGYFVWPCSGRISSRFGYRSIFGSYSFHSGLDIATSYGSSIRASDGGTVTFSGWKGSYGKLVIVNHGNGFQTYYGHCSSLLVGVGDKVYQGQTIAKVGSTGRSTGNHCHFEIKVNGTSVNPLSYLP
ncbi:MAG: M23 family metallopeptidase, partial [Clostridiales bacterium]|nr:M23 family metallopeptidase [Clostridiales bacterium]